MDTGLTRKLEEFSKEISSQYASSVEKWKDSPFAWIRTQPSRRRGKIGEDLVTKLLQSEQFSDVKKCMDSQADLIVEEVRVEVKFSTLWEAGTYTFQQIRDQDYEILVLLGVSPFSAHCWCLSKKLVLEKWEAEDGIVSQHTGATGTDTAWLTFDPERPYDWLQTCGGSLDQGLRALRSHLGEDC